jgi:arabinofuranosyltransferase
VSPIIITKVRQWVEAHTWDILLSAFLGGVGLLVGWWASIITMDDAMITFRVAENLAYGRGFVYNVGERVQVTTTPLYALVLVPGIWLLGSAPRAALLLNLSLSALIPVLAYDLGRRLAGRITGVGGALLLIASPLLVMAYSMESYLYVTLILASMDAYVSRRYLLAGVLVGVTALVRGDGVLLGVCMLGYDTLAHRRLYWRMIIPAMIIPAAWYLFALIYYGSPFPATLGAKVAQGQFNWLRKNFLEGLLDNLADWSDDGRDRIYYLFPLLYAVGLARALWAERPWLILVGRDALYLLAFTVLNVPASEWYYAPLMPGFALLTARGVQLVADAVASLATGRRRTLISAGAATLLLVLLLWLIYPATDEIIREHPDWKVRAYPPTARWIAKNTSASASLATIDIGHLGYWSNRRIIDIVGLAQPDVASHIAAGDFGYAIREYQPDLILIGFLWLKEVQQADWFKEDYAMRQFFKPMGMDQPLLLFSRREGVKVQAETIPAAEIEPLDVDFNRQIRLTGYHLNQPLSPGDEAILTLFWQVEAPIEVDFTVFVQLVDSADNIVAQGDSKPQDGFYTTPYWQPGELVIDTHTFPISADLPPGNYDLLLGFYEAETGHRLQILDAAGAFDSDHVRFSDIGLKVSE